MAALDRFRDLPVGQLNVCSSILSTRSGYSPILGVGSVLARVRGCVLLAVSSGCRTLVQSRFRDNIPTRCVRLMVQTGGSEGQRCCSTGRLFSLNVDCTNTHNYWTLFVSFLKESSWRFRISWSDWWLDRSWSKKMWKVIQKAEGLTHPSVGWIVKWSRS
jgi:hypothetical protein